MSLKAFHILFIVASTLLCIVFGTWAIRQYASGQGTAGELVLGIVSLLLGAGLVWYGKYFLRKLKDISYL
jgi:DNA-binding transcriptional regulator of glucitol operon